jgi:hypothetical protein
MEFLTPSTFTISDAIEKINYAEEQIHEMENYGMLSTPEGHDVLVRTLLLHRLITGTYGPEFFSEDEVNNLNDFIEYLGAVIMEVETGETYDD